MLRSSARELLYGMGMNAKLTPAQRRILAAAAKHTHGRVVGGDPRTRELLVGRGLIGVDGYLYGPLFKITDAGRQAVAPSAKASKKGL